MPTKAVGDVQYLLLPVIDGRQPASWKPWQSPLNELDDRLVSLDFVLPDGYKHLEKYRLRLLFDPPETLLVREKWGRVVGALIDGCSPDDKNPVNTFAELCEKLRQTKDSLYRKFGFYVVVLFPEDPSQEHWNYLAAIRAIATEALGSAVKDTESIIGDAYLIYQLESFNRKAAFYYASSREA